MELKETHNHEEFVGHLAAINQKIDLTRHQNKKAPCISLTEMEQIIQTKEVKMDNKTTLINVFKRRLFNKKRNS